MPYGRIYLPESLPILRLDDRRRYPRHGVETMTPRCPKCSTPLQALQGLHGPIFTCEGCLKAHQQRTARKRGVA